MTGSVFVTGTDTGVGKTIVSAAVVGMLRACGESAGYWKPIQTGSDSDTETVRSLAGPDSSPCPPAVELPLPAAPLRAAQEQGRVIEIAEVAKHFLALPQRRWIVEGAGGLLVPIGPQTTTREFIKELGLPTLVVASTRLGTINHTLLTLECLRNASIKVVGVILAGQEDPGLSDVLEQFSDARVIAHLPHLSALTPRALADWGRNQQDLKQALGLTP